MLAVVEGKCNPAVSSAAAFRSAACSRALLQFHAEGGEIAFRRGGGGASWIKIVIRIPYFIWLFCSAAFPVSYPLIRCDSLLSRSGVDSNPFCCGLLQARRGRSLGAARSGGRLWLREEPGSTAGEGPWLCDGKAGTAGAKPRQGR